jgi:hypothetical protein
MDLRKIGGGRGCAVDSILSGEGLAARSREHTDESSGSGSTE